MNDSQKSIMFRGWIRFLDESFEEKGEMPGLITSQKIYGRIRSNSQLSDLDPVETLEQMVRENYIIKRDDIKRGNVAFYQIAPKFVVYAQNVLGKNISVRKYHTIKAKADKKAKSQFKQNHAEVFEKRRKVFTEQVYPLLEKAQAREKRIKEMRPTKADHEAENIRIRKELKKRKVKVKANAIKEEKPINKSEWDGIDDDLGGLLDSMISASDD